jgi:hypothetical protein
VESLCSIGGQMKERDVVDWFIPLVKVSVRVSVVCAFFFSISYFRLGFRFCVYIFQVHVHPGVKHCNLETTIAVSVS